MRYASSIPIRFMFCAIKSSLLFFSKARLSLAFIVSFEILTMLIWLMSSFIAAASVFAASIEELTRSVFDSRASAAAISFFKSDTVVFILESKREVNE